jgi:hypothetical protein
MPSAPANSANTAAAMGSGSTVRRAWRMVAIWSILTPSVGTPNFSCLTTIQMLILAEITGMESVIIAI